MYPWVGIEYYLMLTHGYLHVYTIPMDISCVYHKIKCQLQFQQNTVVIFFSFFFQSVMLSTKKEPFIYFTKYFIQKHTISYLTFVGKTYHFIPNIRCLETQRDTGPLNNITSFLKVSIHRRFHYIFNCKTIVSDFCTTMRETKNSLKNLEITAAPETTSDL